MAIGPLRGGGSPHIKPPTEKPRDGQADVAPRVLEKAVDGVLKPGQHLLLPAGTGLAHLRDHFDARQTPGYDKLLKGEAPTPAAQNTSTPAPSVAQQALVAGAMAMLERLPSARSVDVTEAEPERQPQDGPVEIAPLLPRTLELQGGLFTLDEGSLDVGGRRLATLEAFLDGDVEFVSVAVDLAAIGPGVSLRIPALETALGQAIPLRAVHQTERTLGTGTALLEVCVSERDPRWSALLDRILTVELG
jgi:hypothetical protein